MILLEQWWKPFGNIDLTRWWLVYLVPSELHSVFGPDSLKTNLGISALHCNACVSEDLQQPGSYWVPKSLFPCLKNMFQVLTLACFVLFLKYFTKLLARKRV